MAATLLSSEHASKPVREWPLLLVLAGAQFAHILDFVLMMPLGPQLMRVLEINPQQFGFLVSIYTFSASLSTFLGAFFIDRFDRRTVLILLTAGFTVGTLFCALSPNYITLLLSRAVTGAFGGLMGAIVFSIIGDAFIETRRGTATGTVMSAFSIASVFGVPFGLYLATKYEWQAPFFLLAFLSSLMIGAAVLILPPMRGHLTRGEPHEGFRQNLRHMMLNKNHLIAYALIVGLMLSAFMVIPFLSPYLVQNVGLTEHHLPYVYLIGGAVTLITSRLFGRFADRFGKQRVFTILASLSIIPLVAITNLPVVSVPLAILVTTAFTVLISGRAVPAMSMITSSVDNKHRGSFMSFTTAIQQLASGFSSLIGGMILGQAIDGRLLNYDIIGVIAVVATLLSIWLANHLKTVT